MRYRSRHRRLTLGTHLMSNRTIRTLATTFLLVVVGHLQAIALESKYVRRLAANHKVIVFVHGLTGDAETTWGKGSVNWPTLLTEDSAFSASNIYVYEYPTKFFADGLSIDEIAEDMRIRFGADGVSEHEQIIFIAHSMGGLVVRSYLLKNRPDFERTQFLYFLATPSTGSKLANAASYLSSNPQIEKMKWIDSRDFLADLTRRWLGAEPPFPTYCAYEKQTYAGQLVVDFGSATYLCTKHPDPIDADHVNIAKPAGNRSPQYQSFAAAYGEQANRSQTNYGLDFQYVRLFGALEVPLLMKELPSSGFKKSGFGAGYRVPRGDHSRNNDVQVGLANFIDRAPFRDARPLVTPMWKDLAGDDVATMNVALRASSANRDERICFLVDSFIDGGSLETARSFGKALPRNWRKRCPEIVKEADRRVGYTFLLFENRSKEAIQNVTFKIRTSYPNNPVLKEFRNESDIEKQIELALKMVNGDPVSGLVERYNVAANVEAALLNADQSELRLSKIDPGEKLIAILDVYISDPMQLPATYLYGIYKFDEMTFQIGSDRRTISIRPPYREKAARVFVPYGWFNQ
jgi:pimeloyl-ACP methyl ester carboxylesterase